MGPSWKIFPNWKVVFPGIFPESEIFSLLFNPAFADNKPENNSIWVNKCSGLLKHCRGCWWMEIRRVDPAADVISLCPKSWLNTQCRFTSKWLPITPTPSIQVQGRTSRESHIIKSDQKLIFFCSYIFSVNEYWKTVRVQGFIKVGITDFSVNKLWKLLQLKITDRCQCLNLLTQQSKGYATKCSVKLYLTTRESLIRIQWFPPFSLDKVSNKENDTLTFHCSPQTTANILWIYACSLIN